MILLDDKELLKEGCSYTIEDFDKRISVTIDIEDLRYSLSAYNVATCKNIKFIYCDIPYIISIDEIIFEGSKICFIAKEYNT